MRGIFAAAAVVCLGTALAATSSERSQTQFSGPFSDVRLALSPDGSRALWGVSGPDAPSDIMESVKTSSGWGVPKPVPFNSAKNDFDPVFSADGRTVYFFSDRDGGYGKSDLYSIAIDPKMGVWGKAINLGAKINTSGDEWAPSITKDGKTLLFSSDGHGGFGKHDLFLAKLGKDGWGSPVNIGPGVNSAEEEFDATFDPRERYIVYAKGLFDKTSKVRLHLAERTAQGWRSRGALPAAINCGAHINFGPAFPAGEAGAFYWSGDCENGRGKSDIWRAVLTLP